ncbi:MAG TPA: hypothetical protein VHQ64_03715, partial [Pyrinomonadaceae bacterium]|nr:hypothetical protein [Pyrinomonadaceae bacterium]
MPEGSIRKLVVVVLAIVVMTGLLVDSAAQKRKRTRRRAPSTPKITNPDIYQPSPVDNVNAGASETSVTGNSNSNSNASQSEDPEAMKKTIRGLSNQVDKLSDKLNEMQ